MAVKTVNKLMLSMGIPMVISMVLQALYNIVDSAFVSKISCGGEDALNALTLAFPMQMLMVAISVGTGVGANALISKCLGQGNREKASRVAGNSLFLAFFVTIIFMIFGFFGVEFFINTQTSNTAIVDMAIRYLRINCIVSFGIAFFSIYEKLLQAGGHSLYSTIAQISGAVLNIILDPIMIYGLFGCPEMGVDGAAWATVIGQIVSFVLAFVFHLKVNKGVSNGLKYLKPSGTIVKEIYSIGLPAIIAQALMSFMTFGLNIILGGISETMVTAYGLYYKVQQFILFAAFGLRDAITPIVSYAHGMKNKQRINDGIKYGMIYTQFVMVIGLVAIELFANPFARMFGLSGETEELCISAMRIISISFLFAGANIAFQGIFQALESGFQSLIVSLCRQLVLLFPFVLAFAQLAKQSEGMRWIVWMSFVICELLSCLVAYILFKIIVKSKLMQSSNRQLSHK